MLLVILIAVVAMKFSGEKNNSPTVPSITKITIFDEDKEEVHEEALWYEASDIEGIMIQWQGGYPDTIKCLLLPADQIQLMRQNYY